MGCMFVSYSVDISGVAKHEACRDGKSNEKYLCTGGGIMACCDYECRTCGWVEVSNNQPDKCEKCGGQAWDLVGFDEDKEDR
jgi:predicted Zn-ribbon and HTH transcriptional regulator